MATMTIEKPAATHSILERTVCLLLQCGSIGNSRKVELTAGDMRKHGQDVNIDEVGASKKLFADADLRPCKEVVGSAKAFVRSSSVDGGMRVFGSGAHLIPTLGIRRVEERLAQFQDDLAVQAELLAQRLPALVEARRAKLGPLFNIGDYPTADGVREFFRIRWSYVGFGAPDRLQEVDAAAYARATHDWDARLSEAYTDVIIGMRQGASVVFRELADRLRPDADGKPRALRPTALRDLQELLERLPILNSVGEDGQLAAIVARVGGYAQGLDVETLKSAPAVRAMLMQQAETAAEQLEALVTSGRAMAF